MARILAISSQVVSGHVGLSAIVPALQHLGHDVLALPTVLLSNHPGKHAASGTRIDPEALELILATLDQLGQLDGIDAVLTGYLPSAAHVTAAANAIKRCRSKAQDTLVLCDPIIGDDPKGVYVEAAAAAAIRDQLVPIADIITPNRFELAWLTGHPVIDQPSAATAAATLGGRLVVATSIPAPEDRLANIVISAQGTHQSSVPRRPLAPNGTGDLLSAFFLSAYLATGHDAARVDERQQKGRREYAEGPRGGRRP